jgi:membrane protease YdiL (CAAX protease family)
VKRDWAALAFAMAFPTLLTWFYFVQLRGEPGEPNPAARLAYAVGKVIQFGFPFVYCLLFERQRLRPSAPTRDGLLLGVLFGLFVNAAIFVLYFAWLRHTEVMAVGRREILGQVRQFGLDTPAAYAAFACFVALLHSLAEEYYFRWFVFGLLRRHVGLATAVGLSSLSFMAHHVILLAVYFPGAEAFVRVVVPFALAVAAGGAVWAWLYDRARSLYAPWVSHLLIDAGLMALGYVLVAPDLRR